MQFCPFFCLLEKRIDKVMISRIPKQVLLLIDMHSFITFFHIIGCTFPSIFYDFTRQIKPLENELAHSK